MARSYDGSTSDLRTSIGGSNFADGITGVVLCRLTGRDGAWRNLLALDNGTTGAANVRALSMELAGSGGTANALRFGVDGLASVEAATPFTTAVADGWVLLAGGKITGTAVARLHQYKYSTGVFTHQSASSTLADGVAPGSGGRVQIGGDLNGSGDWFQGDIALAGIFHRALTDAEFEALAFTLQAWYALNPSGLWMLDQDKTSQKVVDLVGGGANETSSTALAVATASVPAFNYADGVWVPTIVTPAGGTIATVTPQSANAAFTGSAVVTATTTVAPQAANALFAATAAATAATTVVPASADVVFASAATVTTGTPANVIPAASNAVFATTAAVTAPVLLTATSNAVFATTGLVTAPTTVAPSPANTTYASSAVVTTPGSVSSSTRLPLTGVGT